MSKRNKLLALCLTLVLSLSLVGCGDRLPGGGMISSGNEQILKAGEIAPDFTAKLTNGEKFTLSSNKGKIVLINFWATWCEPCVDELPALEKIKNEYKGKVEVITVNYGEDKKVVKKFLKENDYTFKIAYDNKMEICEKYPSDGIPYTIIVDKDGKVYDAFLGADVAEKQYKHLKEIIDNALNGIPAEQEE